LALSDADAERIAARSEEARSKATAHWLGQRIDHRVDQRVLAPFDSGRSL
jgi:hypothetical protein